MEPLHQRQSARHLVLLAAIVLTLLASLTSSAKAFPMFLLRDESGSLDVVLTVTPNVSRRGGTITIIVKIENIQGAVASAAVKILLTFSDGRQISASGISNANGIFSYTAKIPSGASPGSGKVDIIVRSASTVAIASSSFTIK